MSDNIKAVVAKINKKFGENTLSFASNLQYGNVDRLPSGSLFLDYALGSNKKDKKAGWPLGRIIELYGPESSGKSLISMKTIVEAQKLGYDCAYIDCENTFDKNFAELLGVDTSKLLITTESRAGKVIDMACEILKEYPNIRVIVFDSLASMIPEVEVEADLDAQQMAPMARLMSKGLRKLTLFNKNNAILIFINQLRENPGAGMYANPEYTPGGKAIKFYASIRAEIRKGEFLFDEEEKKKKVGQTVKFKIVKNKTDVPFREGYFKFIYEQGILDNVDELVSIGLLKGVIQRKGAWFSIGERTFQGREDMEKALKADGTFFEEARKEIFSVE
jgi:recombination protein RecA